MGFFGFIIIIILAVFFILLSFVGNILRLIFGLGRSAGNQRRQSEQTANSKESLRSPSKKVFAKDDGEYVDFEEIKEDQPEKDR
jgi:Sec-independent protein translocase protein TatA